MNATGDSLTVLYTCGLRGDLALLPRLSTRLKALRAEVGRVVLLDLGESCADSVWHCEVTGGRSMLIGLDALGYAAANTQSLKPEARARLEADENRALALVDDAHPWEGDLFTAFTGSPTAEHERLLISLEPSDVTRLEENVLRLARVQAGQLGAVHLSLNSPVLESSAVHHVLPGTLPDPTITAAIDFIEHEARYFVRKSGG